MQIIEETSYMYVWNEDFQKYLLTLSKILPNRELVGNFMCSVHARQFRKYWPVLVSVQKLRKVAHQGVIF
jgi:hypothetical protein